MLRTCRCHVFGRLNRLEADEGDLHGAEQAEDEEGVVGDVDAVGEPVHQDEDEDVKWDQVDDEHVAAPCRHLRRKWPTSKTLFQLGT